jgi:dihydrofolate reductase
MGKVFSDITMSLDGFIAGTHITNQQPMGEGGLRLHDWMFKNKSTADAALLDELVETSGAVIVGNRTYITAIDEAWEGVSPFNAPAFVLSHSVPEVVVKGFTFVTNGLESALMQAKSAAGDKNVWVMGGANIIQQYIQAGFIDEITIHIASVLLTGGTRLFEHIGAESIELEQARVIESTGVTHLKFRIVK